MTGNQDAIQIEMPLLAFLQVKPAQWIWEKRQDLPPQSTANLWNLGMADCWLMMISQLIREKRRTR
ncbi:hypothetical protein EFM55_14170 [Lactiplantibacillus pentosus]|nr:hypothetical protein [Lactiplantibacillus pentosus]